MLTAISWLLALVLFTVPAHALTVYNNAGGIIAFFDLQANAYASDGEHVRLVGKCDSACTIFLRLNKLCVGRRVRLGFHQASYMVPTGRDREWIKVRSDDGTAILFNQYPDWVQDWITERGGLTHKLIYMGFDEASKHIKECQ